MSDLTEFLLARIADDEARLVGSSDIIPGDRWGPDRVEAECEAKRRVVERAANVQSSGPARDNTRAMDMTVGADAAYSDVCRMLATVYADHPDYRQGWRL